MTFRYTLLLLFAALVVPAALAQVSINEIYAVPVAGPEGDANGDGASNNGDEFVEIVNWGSEPFPLQGYHLHVSNASGTSSEYVYPFGQHAVLAPGEAIIVFGAGMPAGDFGGAQVVLSHFGNLYLDNNGGTVDLRNGGGVILASTSYEGFLAGASHARNPDQTGNFVDHPSIATNPVRFSPGLRNDNGQPFILEPNLVLNEVLLDPAGGLDGDANGDGTGDASADEFIEILNMGTGAADLSGYVIEDRASLTSSGGVAARHVFADGTVLGAGRALVVFGGGTPTGPFGDSEVVTASSGGLGLDDDGDTVYLLDAAAAVVDSTSFDGSVQDEAFARTPDATGGFVAHTTIRPNGVRFSPGLRNIDGMPFDAPVTSAPGLLSFTRDFGLSRREGSGFSLRVQLDYNDGIPNGTPVTVAITQIGGDATPADDLGIGDYTVSNEGRITFLGTTEGETRQANVSIRKGDGDEPTETAVLRLSVVDGEGAIGAVGTFTLTILDDDPLDVVSVAAARTAGVGEYVSVEGVVTRARGAFTYLQDETGGLVIRQTTGDFFDDVVSGAVGPGARVRVTGTLSEPRQLLQIDGEALNSYSTACCLPIPEPQTVTLAELVADGEAYESELVTVETVTLGAGDNDGGTFAPATTYPISDASDATGAVSLRIPDADDTTVDGTDVPPRATLTAIVGQSDAEDPAAGYQLLVIEAEDVEALPAVATETRPDGSVVSLTVANPIRGASPVRFSAGTAMTATVALYDVLGRRVATLADGPVAGEATATLDTSRLAAGVYVLRLQAEDVVLTETVTVVR